MKKKTLLLTLGVIASLSSSLFAFTACSVSELLENWEPWTPWVQDEVVEETPCDHIIVHHEGKESNCNTRGFRAYDECLVCCRLFVDGVVKTESEILLDFDYTKHTALKSFEGTPATCVTVGSAAYDSCTDCGKIYVNGKEVSQKDISLPVDATNHEALVNVAETPATCVSDGAKAHDACSACQKIFIGGVETAVKDLVIKASGAHNFTANALDCSGCDAYKMLYNGSYYLIDSANRQDFKTHSEEGMTAGYSSTVKLTYLNYYPTHCMEFSTQLNTGVTVQTDARNWNITSTLSSNTGTFTRFSYGSGNAPYVGRFLMIFDYSADAAIVLDRLGVKVVNLEGNVVSGGINSKLLGKNTAEENNANRVITPNTTYRMMYVVETTAKDQLVQIWNCFAGPATTTISNMHFIPLEETGFGIPSASLIQFSEADACVVAKENCAHAWAEEVAGKAATCEATGILAHVACRQCGQLIADGAAVTDVILPALGHTKGDWQNNVDQHWKYCSVCETNVELGNHIPGPAATMTSDQVCTVCNYVIQSALGHVHQMTYVEAKRETCTTDGNVNYYHCTSCEKNYLDQEGATEITESVVIKASGHEMVHNPAVAATCTTDGNMECYSCPKCSENYADEAGETLIEGSVIITALGHDMTYRTAQEATCYTMGNETPYYACANCKKYYAEESAKTELAAADIFTQAMTSHNFSAGKCTNSGCTVEQTAAEIKANSASFGNSAATVNPTLLANPGTWASQTSSSNVTASISNNVLKVMVKNNSKDTQYKSFNRILPADPDNPDKAFVGVYMWSFDFKVTSALGSYSTTKANLKVGFFIQEVTGKTTFASIAEQVKVFEVGKTYHFSVIVENSDAGHFAQFNVRQMANSGATFEISNASYAFYPEQSAIGVDRMISVAFAEEVAEPLSAEVYTQPQAILPKKEQY